MKRLTLTLWLIGLLTGCSTAASFVPSLEYCDEVLYHRVQSEINVVMKCRYEK